MTDRYTRIARHFALLLALAAPAVGAQTPGTCAPGTATAVLDANDVVAGLYNQGNLFFGSEGEAQYVVPRLTGYSPIYATNLWFSGTVSGELRLAGSRYANFQYWPGPLLDGGNLPNPADCTPYDHIWKVSRADVRAYLRGEAPTSDLASWPVALGAPVIDGDGDPTNYNLVGGDQPEIVGDQAAFWVMNDVGSPKDRHPISNALGLEVQVYAYAGESFDGVVSPSPDQTTFYRYRFVNRSPVPIDNAFASLYTVFSGFPLHAGADTTFGMGYAYDAFDTGSYGGPLSAAGIVVAEGPAGLPNDRDDDRDGEVDEPGERTGMSSFVNVLDGGVGTTEPVTTPEYRHYQEGRWGDGQPIREGNGGRNPTGRITRFTFPGDPVRGTFWTEENTGHPQWPVWPPGSRYASVSVGPFRLAPGASDDVTFAIVYAPATVGRHSAIENLRQGADYARRGIGLQTGPTALTTPPLPGEPVPPPTLALYAPRPNPFAGSARVGYNVPAAMRVRLALYDALGREVAVLADGMSEPGSYEAMLGAGLPAGTYLLRFSAGSASRAVVVTVQR